MYFDYDHYIQVLKYHELTRTSTNDRNKYWSDYNEKNKQMVERKTEGKNEL